MKTTDAKTQLVAEPATKRLRDEQTFLNLYSGILTALYSRGNFKAAAANFVEWDDYAQNLARLAFIAAHYAFAQLDLAEPAGETEIEQFNQAVSNAKP